MGGRGQALLRWRAPRARRWEKQATLLDDIITDWSPLPFAGGVPATPCGDEVVARIAPHPWGALGVTHRGRQVMDLSSRRISESGEQYTTAGRDFHAQSSDDERARRQSVASLGSLDDAPRDRLVALLNDIISGRHVDCSSAQEVSCYVTPRLLLRWRGGGGTLSDWLSAGCPFSCFRCTRTVHCFVTALLQPFLLRHLLLCLPRC